MYLIKGHIISSLYFALSTSSFTLLFLLNVLYSCTFSGSGNQIKSNQINTKLMQVMYIIAQGMVLKLCFYIKEALCNDCIALF